MSPDESRAKPVVILAFANEQEGRRYLRELPEEQRRLRVIVRTAESVCEAEVIPNATGEELAEVFARLGRRVAILHYGGHAGPDGLLLESVAGEPGTAHVAGLAGLLREHGTPFLVFLNGCATWAYVQALHNAGVPAVIATARAIRDDQAREFAVSFYSRIAEGQSLDTACRQAQSVVCLAKGADPQAYIDRDVITRVNVNRDLIPIGATSEIDDHGLPWKLSLATDAPLAGEWSLRTVDPRWGLKKPDLPQPAAPYIGLRPFTHQDAGVFFGRRAEIRELYDAVITPGGSPLIFCFGQSGVGKSSVLDAGLVPWLSMCATVRYVCRVPQLGLLGTLQYELAQAAGAEVAALESDLLKLWEEAAPSSPAKPIVVILDQAEEAYLKPCLYETATSPKSSDTGPQAELRSFFDELKRVLAGPATAPYRRVLVLGFRKEWQPEFSRAARESGLTPGEVFLRPLGRAGIIEAIEGPSRVAARPRSERPELASPGLADEIATDILRFVADPEKNRLYPLTPTLQSLLERMWLHAKKLTNVEPVFDRDLFIAAQKDGYGLDRYLARGLSALEKWRAEVVTSGLALDLLQYHTKPLGTADQHTPAELRDQYKDHRDVLDSLVQECKSNYLLIDVPEPAPPGTTCLPHDTLAPVVRDEFVQSMRPGQRARRLLENRAPEWRDGNDGPVLDAVDLAAVKSGLTGMRSLTADEERLVEATGRSVHVQQAKEHRRRRVLRGLGFALAIVFVGNLITTIVAWTMQGVAQRQTKIAEANEITAKEQTGIAQEQTKKAEAQTRLAESRRLAAASDAVRPERLDLAMLLALESAKEADTLEARGSMQRSLDERQEVVCFLGIPEGEVNTVAFGPDGRLAAGYDAGRVGGGVVLFDANGERLRPAPMQVKEGHVNSVAFGPEGRLAVGYDVAGEGDGEGSGGVVLCDARGERLRPATLEVEEGHVNSVAFGPDGMIAAGFRVGSAGGVVLFGARGERLRPAPLEVPDGNVTSVAFGPKGEIAAGYKGRGVGGLVLFDARGERLVPAPLPVKEGEVTSVAFGPGGKIAVGFGVGDRVIKDTPLVLLGNGAVVAEYHGGGVVLFDARGERLGPAPLAVKEGEVTSVAFGPGGEIAAGYGVYRGGGGVVLFDASGERFRAAPLVVKEGQVSSVAFGPEGKIAAGCGRGGVVLCDARGERLRPAPSVVKEGFVWGVAFGPRGRFAAGYGRGGTFGGGVVLFDARGERLRPAPLEVKEGFVRSVASGPEGKFAAAYSSAGRGGVVLFDARGARLRPAPLEIKEGEITSVAFGPDGGLAAGYRVVSAGGVVLFDVRGERLRPAPLEVKEGNVSSVVIGPQGNIAAGYGGAGGGGVVLFDARGERLRLAPLEVKEGSVTSVALGPQSAIAAGYELGLRGGVVLFDARGERLRPAPLEVKAGNVSSVAFGPKGNIAAGYGVALGWVGGVVLFDAQGEWLRPAPLDVREGEVTSVAFGPEGKIAAGYGGPGVSGVVLFDADPASWRRKAGRTANRNLTRLEWIRYFPETPYRRTLRSLPWPHDLPEDERKQAEVIEEEHPEGNEAL
jgi:CHAT domain